MKFELGLSRNYIADWGVQDALREFIQNGIDQKNTVEGNDLDITYEDGKLCICNKKSVLGKGSLLLGATTKSNDDETIGKFGEGYKLALLVLTREGKKVTIFNYGNREVWNVRFSKMKKYEGTEVLVVDVDTKHIWSRVPNNDLTIQIEGITEEEYEECKERTLFLREDYEYKPTSIGNILFGEEFIHKVYVNGLFVAEKNDFFYGYDFKPTYIKIGRDRNLVDSWDMMKLTRLMWLETNDQKSIKEMVRNNVYDVNNIENTVLYNSPDSICHVYESLQTSMYDDFVSEYGNDTLVASSETEKNVLKQKYKKNVVVFSDSEKALISKSDKYQNMLEEIEQSRTSYNDKILDWVTENCWGNTAAESLMELLEPMINAYQEKYGDFYENAEEPEQQ